jgi:hypothetical protein
VFGLFISLLGHLGTWFPVGTLGTVPLQHLFQTCLARASQPRTAVSLSRPASRWLVCFNSGKVAK